MSRYLVTTQESYDSLMELLEGNGYTWSNGVNPTELNYFTGTPIVITIRLNRELAWCSKELADDMCYVYTEYVSTKKKEDKVKELEAELLYHKVELYKEQGKYIRFFLKHLNLEESFSYLNLDIDGGLYHFNDSKETEYYQTIFSERECEEIQKLFPEVKKVLVEVL